MHIAKGCKVLFTLKIIVNEAWRRETPVNFYRFFKLINKYLNIGKLSNTKKSKFSNHIYSFRTKKICTSDECYPNI